MTAPRDRFIVANRLTHHLVEWAGDGPLVILLHGFGQYWRSWRYQLPGLAQAGFRVVAPDLRGYNLSDKPAGVENCRAKLLMADVLALGAHYSRDKFVLVAHDWGGAVAWAVAIGHAARLAKLRAAMR